MPISQPGSSTACQHASGRTIQEPAGRKQSGSLATGATFVPSVASGVRSSRLPRPAEQAHISAKAIPVAAGASSYFGIVPVNGWHEGHTSNYLPRLSAYRDVTTPQSACKEASPALIIRPRLIGGIPFHTPAVSAGLSECESETRSRDDNGFASTATRAYH